MDHITFETRPIGRGYFSCTVNNGSGWVSFLRNREGKIRKSASTTTLTDSEFRYAFKEAIRRIEEAEREHRAGRPDPAPPTHQALVEWVQNPGNYLEECRRRDVECNFHICPLDD